MKRSYTETENKQNTIHHEIDEINERYNLVSSEDEFAVIGNNTELIDTHELGTNIESNPFPFSEEKKPFYKEDNKRHF